jgi:EAL domain-containing protein (putative c-di-GMP-specific phosphodiesterase class I)
MTDQTPLSGTIIYWVIDTVAEELGDWLDDNKAARVSINVRPEILGRGGLEYAATKSGLRARVTQPILEITERGIPDQLGLDALNSIPSTGAHVALDDTTFSGANLALLTRCHFGFVKIDPLLVEELAPDKPVAAWLGGLAAVLRTTSLQVITEGVEKALQADVLRAAGVQLAQGHHFRLPGRHTISSVTTRHARGCGIAGEHSSRSNQRLRIFDSTKERCSVNRHKLSYTLEGSA